MKIYNGKDTGRTREVFGFFLGLGFRLYALGFRLQGASFTLDALETMVYILGFWGQFVRGFAF